MQQQDSKTVTVKLKDENIVMAHSNGSRLMEYLTGENSSSHVMITKLNGDTVVVNKHDIKKIEVTSSKLTYKTPAQLGMPDLG